MSTDTVQETENSESQEPRVYTEEQMQQLAEEIENLRASEAHYKSELSKVNDADAKKRIKIRELTSVLEGKDPEPAEEPASDTVSRDEFESWKADLRRRDYQDLLNSAAEKANANPRLVRSLMMEGGVPQDIDFTDLASAETEIEARLNALIEEVPEIQKKTGASSQHQDWVGPEPVEPGGVPRDVPAYLERVAKERGPEELLKEYNRLDGDKYISQMVDDPTAWLS